MIAKQEHWSDKYTPKHIRYMEDKKPKRTTVIRQWPRNRWADYLGWRLRLVFGTLVLFFEGLRGDTE